MISYKNKSKKIPTTKEIIGFLVEKNVDFILVGSQIGKYYGICEDPYDIDFLIPNSLSNTSKIFFILQEFFNVQSIDEILKIDILHLMPKEKIPIQLFKYPWNKDCNCLIASEEYEKLKKDSTVINFYDYDINAISLKYYIDCMVFVVECLSLTNNRRDGFSLTNKSKKYKQIIDNYKDKYERIYEFVDKT